MRDSLLESLASASLASAACTAVLACDNCCTDCVSTGTAATIPFPNPPKEFGLLALRVPILDTAVANACLLKFCNWLCETAATKGDEPFVPNLILSVKPDAKLPELIAEVIPGTSPEILGILTGLARYFVTVEAPFSPAAFTTPFI